MKNLLLYFLLISSLGMKAQWTTQATSFTNVSEGVKRIRIIDANTVWAQGYDGSNQTPANYQDFTLTTNGGTTWTHGAINIGNTALKVNNISAVDNNTAWVSAVSTTLGKGGVWKTIDGGSSWVQQNATAYTDPLSFMNTVHFFNPTTGIASGDPITGATDFEVYRTTDGGATWSPINSTIPDIISGEYGYDDGNVSAGGNAYWFITNKGKMYRTSDLGANWAKLDGPTGLTDFAGITSLGQLFFSDIESQGAGTNYGICIARAGALNTNYKLKLHTTTDGGTTWSTGVAYDHPYKFLAFIKGTTLLVGTGSKTVGTTTTYYSGFSSDYGTTWTEIDNGEQRTEIAFFNETTGWAGGFTNSSTSGGIFKYTGASLANSNFNNTKLNITAIPNPTTGVLKLTANTVDINEVVVFDVLGKQVYNSKINAMNEILLDLSILHSGIYLVKVTSDSGNTETLKIMKN